MVKKRGAEKSSAKTSRSDKLEDKLVQNLIELQKLHVGMIEKFDNLSGQIANLLALFETSAKTFAKSPSMDLASKDHEFLQKIDKLLDQNKVLAKGLTLMEQKLRERMYGSSGTENSTPGF